MPLCPKHTSHQVKEAHSRLGRSLVKIQKTYHASKVETENLETMFRNWEKKWMHRRELISSRIQMIENQLKELGESDLPLPQFAIFDAPGE